MYQRIPGRFQNFQIEPSLYDTRRDSKECMYQVSGNSLERDESF